MLDLRNRIPTADKVVGLRQVRREIATGRVTTVILALDADAALREEVTALADAHGAELHYFPSMDELGRLCEIDVRCAVVGLTADAE